MLLGSVIHVSRQVKSTYNDIEQGFRAFFQAESEGTPSAFGQTVSAVGEIIGGKVAGGVTHSLNTSLGGTMKGVNAELEAQALAENPTLAALELMPKSMKKNPKAMLGLAQILNNVLNSSKGQNGSNTSNSSHNLKFDL